MIQKITACLLCIATFCLLPVVLMLLARVLGGGLLYVAAVMLGMAWVIKWYQLVSTEIGTL